MLYEDLRYVSLLFPLNLPTTHAQLTHFLSSQLHEDIERLEAAIADRIEDQKHLRLRLERDHEIANFLSRIQSQSERALHIYNNEQEARTQEVQSISTGDPLEEFSRQYESLKDFHKRYPNEPVENLERAYRKVENGGPGFAGDVDGMFTGEESYGRFFDLTMVSPSNSNNRQMNGGSSANYGAAT